MIERGSIRHFGLRGGEVDLVRLEQRQVDRAPLAPRWAAMKPELRTIS